MTSVSQGESIILGYDGEDCNLEFRRSVKHQDYVYSRSDRYWEIGIALPNVDIAWQQLTQMGVAVSKPRQFEEIGYLCHFTDPAGFNIELIQHYFLDPDQVVLATTIKYWVVVRIWV